MAGVIPLGSRGWITPLRCSEILENQQWRLPFSSFKVAHGLGNSEGGTDNECGHEQSRACDQLESGWLFLGREDDGSRRRRWVPAAVPSTVHALSPLLLPPARGGTHGCCPPLTEKVEAQGGLVP